MDKRISRKWLIAIKSGKKPTRHTKICSKHFDEACYKVTSMGKQFTIVIIISLNILIFYCIVFTYISSK